MVSLLDFINSISQTDDIQDVSNRTVGRKVDLLAPGGGRPTAPPPPGYGPGYVLHTHVETVAGESREVSDGTMLNQS